MAEATVSIEDHILNFIKQIAEEQNFKTFETEITPVFTNGANYTSNLYKVKITGEGRSLDLFSKVAALHENCRDASKWDPFVTETLFYTDLLKTYRGLEEKHGVDVKDRFKCPVFYGAKVTYLRELLVLEDLTSQGFTMTDRLQSVDWPYAAATIAELAKFHALSVVFRHESPNEFNKTTKGFPVDSFLGNTAVENMFKEGLQSALAAIPDESKEKLSSCFRDRDVLLWITELGRPGRCRVITHSHFKPVNIMYRVLNDGSIEAMPVDFQGLTVGSPIIDLLYFIFTSTDGSFRAKYYQKMIDHYYSNFSDTLARLGLNVDDVFPRDVFDAELKEKLPYGLLMTVTFLPVFLVSAEDAPVIGDDFSNNLAVKGTGALYAQRINDVIRDYITWGVLGNSPSAEDNLQNVIKKIALEQKFKIYNTKITQISTQGANYTSTLYKVKITGEGKNLDLFAKVAALNEKLREKFAYNPFTIETVFYTDLMKTYRKLEEKHDIPMKERLKCPMYYGAETTHLSEILVLDDLTSKGFVLTNRFESVDWSYATAAMSELAKFHALSLTFQNETPVDFETFIRNIPGEISAENSGVDGLFKEGLASALAVVSDENKERLNDYYKNRNIMETFNDLYKRATCKVINHSDFRPSNLLHKVMDDGSNEVYPVDYQTIQFGSPVIDLIHFIITATDGAFRAAHYQDLIEYYYSELGVALKRFGLNVEEKFPRNKFDLELKEKLPFGLMMSIALLPILLVPEDKAPTFGDDFSSIVVAGTGDLYTRRINDMVHDCIKWGIL